MKCGVVPGVPFVSAHNTIQGRAVVFDDAGQVAGYSAIAFRRLSDGDFTGVFDLDGVSYEMCPSRLHFDVLSVKSGSQSEIILTPCNQDLLNQVPESVTASILITNEFEQTFSASRTIQCWERLTFTQLSGTLSKAVLGTDTAHLSLRGVQSSVLGIVLDKFSAFGQPVTAANEPFLSGGKVGKVIFP